ncbi:hypothetical protein CRD60_00245 [Bifidobacterium aemilianum]|uniref:Uncharacterized protein n=1 Tax=Bifidobacterium aemilianum TaxID=2493120 RepID=A0A366K9D0_9BIFI|nr:hypothetical protein [Bifidobacterium aemilianum]RBP98350.1 hypothetical protein CRD60_00245 [Bifidobacterium aemilianum]
MQVPFDVESSDQLGAQDGPSDDDHSGIGGFGMGNDASNGFGYGNDAQGGFDKDNDDAVHAQTPDAFADRDYNSDYDSDNEFDDDEDDFDDEGASVTQCAGANPAAGEENLIFGSRNQQSGQLQQKPDPWHDKAAHIERSQGAYAADVAGQTTVSSSLDSPGSRQGAASSGQGGIAGHRRGLLWGFLIAVLVFVLAVVMPLYDSFQDAARHPFGTSSRSAAKSHTGSQPSRIPEVNKAYKEVNHMIDLSFNVSNTFSDLQEIQYGNKTTKKGKRATPADLKDAVAKLRQSVQTFKGLKAYGNKMISEAFAPVESKLDAYMTFMDQYADIPLNLGQIRRNCLDSPMASFEETSDYDHYHSYLSSCQAGLDSLSTSELPEIKAYVRDQGKVTAKMNGLIDQMKALGTFKSTSYGSEAYTKLRDLSSKLAKVSPFDVSTSPLNALDDRQFELDPYKSLSDFSDHLLDLSLQD